MDWYFWLGVVLFAFNMFASFWCAMAYLAEGNKKDLCWFVVNLAAAMLVFATLVHQLNS